MILVVADHKDGKLRKSALELAGGLGAEVAGLVIGGDVTGVAESLAQYVGKVLAVSDAALAEFRAEPWTTVVTKVAKDTGAQAVLVAASRSGLSFSPRVAMRLDAPLLEDVTRVEVQDGKVVARRLTYLSRVTETVRAETLPVVVSVKPNVYPVAQEGAGGSVESLQVDLSGSDTRAVVGEKRKAATGRVALDEASIVVTGGRGVGSTEGFTELVESLADTLGAGVGSTRAVVDAGWRPYAEQVGQTGKTVAPSLYIALGVSGAVQHLSGMNRSKVVVAINKDADAPIFKVADYGIVGDVNKIVPELRQALAAMKE
jgi:electron transfer flavoprotein alpha subunit